MITLIRMIKKGLRSFCPVLICAILLSLWGCLAIYNASLQFEQPGYYAIRQCAWLIGGIILALIFYRTSAKKIFEFIPLLYVLGVASLFSVLMVGSSHHYMRGWFHTGWFSIQPSEFFKPVFCLFLCWYADKMKKRGEDDLTFFLKLFGSAVPGLILIGLQPDFGTLLIFVILLLTIYWIYGCKMKYLAISFGCLIPPALFVIYKYPYVMGRFRGFWNPEAHAEGAGFHLLQLERAIASGGFLGRSFGKGLWSQGYLPLTHNDSIFASFCEAAGFLGGFVIILVFTGAFMAVIRKIGRMQNDLYGKALFILVFCIGVQAMIHISVNVQLLPPTGLTLPFFSYGGSSLISSFLIVGFCKSLIRTEKRERVSLESGECSEIEPFEEDFDPGKPIPFEKAEIA